jgi:hypothetical protein
MRAEASLALAALLAAAAPCAAAALDEASWAAPLAAVRPPARPSAPPPTAPVDEAALLRAALRARLPVNPVAAEFASPVAAGAEFPVELKRESEDAALHGAWASYRRDRRALIVNRDVVEEDARARGVPPPGAAELADRFLPVFVHELGGHARHYAELAKLLGAPGPSVRETEVCALWLEASAVAAERRLRPDYLRDGSGFAADEERLLEKYWESKRRGDFEVFRAYVAAQPAYARLPSAYDGAAAAGPVAAYFHAEESRIREADRRLVGDARSGDEPPPERPFEGGRGMRR